MSETTDDEGFSQCELCGTGIMPEDDLQDHIEQSHYTEPAKVREYYGDKFDNLFEEDADENDEIEESELFGRNARRKKTSLKDAESQSEKATKEESSEEGTQEPQTSSSSGAIGNKWYLIGVGGAGGRIVDSILSRKHSMEGTDKPLAGVWEKALTGHTILNTNWNDFQGTFFFDEMNAEMEESDLLNGNTIGIEHPENDYRGCGENWQTGKEYIEHDFDDGNPIEEGDGYNIRSDDLPKSQAVMIANSTAGGTGCGAAPVLAREIKKLDNIKEKKIFGSVVLPSESDDEDDVSSMANGIAGTARMARYADAVLVFENGCLEMAAAELDFIDDLERHSQYANKNNAILKYFEIFSMASIGVSGIGGADFDINDALGPLEKIRDQDKEYYPNETEDDMDFSKPGNILAPVIAKSSRNEMTEQTIELMTERALRQNQLADFDPSTAWGGTFVFFGPEEKLDNDLITGKFNDLVEEEYLDVPDGRTYIRANPNMITVDRLDSVYLWGFLWNPDIESINRMYEAAEWAKGDGTLTGSMTDDAWPVIEGLMEQTGRENMGGQ